MAKIIKLSNDYKDDLFTFLNSSICVCKPNNEESFLNDVKLINQSIKKEIRIYLAIDDKKIVSSIGLDKNGKITFFYINSITNEQLIDEMLSYCEQVLTKGNCKEMTADVNMDNILLFNNRGFKTVCISGHYSAKNFLVRKTISE